MTFFKHYPLLLALVVSLLFPFFLTRDSFAQECLQGNADEKLACLKRQIEETGKKLSETKQKSITLQNEIAYQDNQINLTILKVQETEEQIGVLGSQIDYLETSLTGLSEIFTQRVIETYKFLRVGDPLTLFIVSDSAGDFVSRFHYLQKVQQNDRAVLLQMQTTQTNYETQKEKVEALREKLEEQRQTLASQKAQKQHLLSVTKNDEKRFQQLLSQARAELEAIQAIIAGKGTETEVGKVNTGDKIASIISGASCNSSGSHLHFIVRQGSSTQDPFSHLRSGVDYENCSGSSCGGGDADSFNPSGNWDWPINPKIRMTQGYGVTWAVRNTWVGRIYGFHNGIDIDSYSSNDIKAVKSGTLYRGSFSGSGSCALRYVRVDHDDSDLDTLYLHVDY